MRIEPLRLLQKKFLCTKTLTLIKVNNIPLEYYDENSSDDNLNLIGEDTKIYYNIPHIQSNNVMVMGYTLKLIILIVLKYMIK